MQEVLPGDDPLTMRWTQDQLNEYQNRRKAKAAKPECPVCDVPLAAPEGEEKNTGRILVRIIGRRVRLLDPDNCICKYHLDCLRYAGIIPNDREEDIELHVKQEKVCTKAEECTIIEVEGI